MPVGLEDVMAKPRGDSPVRIDREVIRTAKIVAAFEGKSLTDYLSDILRPTVENDYRRHIAEAAKREGKSKW